VAKGRKSNSASGLSSGTSRTLGLILIVLSPSVNVLSRCASMPAREPMNAELQEVAKMPEIPNVRNWGNSRPEDCDEWMTLSKQEIRERYPA